MNNNEIRISHICSYFDNILFSNLIENQMNIGINSRVCYFRARSKVVRKREASHVDSIECYNPIDRIIFHIKEYKALLAYKKAYNKKQFDLLFAHSLFSNGFIAYNVKKRWGIPYIVMVQNTDLNVFFKWMIHLRKLGIDILCSADKIIFASPAYQKLLLTKYLSVNVKKVIEDKTMIIPYGIEDVFYQMEGKAKTISSKKTLNLLTVGLVCRNKNQLGICKVIEQMNKEGFHITYTIIGKVQDKSLMDKIRKYDFVTYIPFMEKRELIHFYRAADIFILNSIYETFGLVYGEAIAQGLPVIYTKGQGFDQQFPEGLVGYHVECFDEEGIINAIKKILSNYDKISEQCVIASRKFKWETISESYKNLYIDILEN